MTLRKPTLGKRVWSLMTPKHLFVGLEPKYFYSAQYQDRGSNYYTLMSIGAELDLKSGRVKIHMDTRPMVQTLLWQWIHKDVPVVEKDDDHGLYSSISGADPLTRKVLDVIRKHLVSEKYLKGTVLIEHIKIPKGMLQRKGDVLYFGYRGTVLQTHSLDTIHRLVRDAVSVGKKAWGWEPKNMKMFCHPSGRAMGLAYQPGKGAHAISLNTRLLRGYDKDSIYRVLLHELCHHYREETWPREYISAHAHDEVFCRELSKVDPIVAQSGNCRYFRDEQWLQSAAVIQKKKREKTISWKPQDGYLVFRRLKGGALKLDWLPKEPGAFRKKVFNVGYEPLAELLSKFTMDQLQRVEVINQMPEYSTFYKILGETTNLGLLMNLLTQMYPSYHFEKLREVLK